MSQRAWRVIEYGVITSKTEHTTIIMATTTIRSGVDSIETCVLCRRQYRIYMFSIKPHLGTPNYVIKSVLRLSFISFPLKNCFELDQSRAIIMWVG